MFTHVKPGDTVRRMLAGVIPMDLKVGLVTDELIICGTDEDSGWCFCRKTGLEVDKLLGWGPDTHTGSYLVPYVVLKIRREAGSS